MDRWGRARSRTWAAVPPHISAAGKPNAPLARLSPGAGPLAPRTGSRQLVPRLPGRGTFFDQVSPVAGREFQPAAKVVRAHGAPFCGAADRVDAVLTGALLHKRAATLVGQEGRGPYV